VRAEEAREGGGVRARIELAGGQRGGNMSIENLLCLDMKGGYHEAE
jgi:hypothetical protein